MFNRKRWHPSKEFRLALQTPHQLNVNKWGEGSSEANQKHTKWWRFECRVDEEGRRPKGFKSFSNGRQICFRHFAILQRLVPLNLRTINWTDGWARWWWWGFDVLDDGPTKLAFAASLSYLHLIHPGASSGKTLNRAFIINFEWWVWMREDWWFHWWSCSY